MSYEVVILEVSTGSLIKLNSSGVYIQGILPINTKIISSTIGVGVLIFKLSNPNFTCSAKIQGVYYHAYEEHTLSVPWHHVLLPHDIVFANRPTQVDLPHSGHEVARNMIEGKSFFYCRHCKAEIDQADNVGRLSKHNNVPIGQGFIL